MDRRLENHCHYSGLPSPQAYESNEQINKLTNMKNKLQQYYPLLLAFVSFLFSVGLWFTGYKEEGMFVGIWVPSILACGCFLNTINK